MAARALDAPLRELTDFLRYAQSPMPEVWHAIRDRLAEDSTCKAMVARALDAPLGELTDFLRYAQSPMPEVWRAIGAALVDNANQQELIDRVLATSLEQLTDFLRYLQLALAAAWNAICDTLTAENHREALVKCVLKTPAEHFGPFLRYAASAERLAALRSRLPAILLDAGHRLDALAWFEAAGPEKIPGLCREEPLLKNLVGEIDPDKWLRVWGSADLGIPHWFIRFSQLCANAVKPELASISARAIIDRAIPEHFDASSINLRHVSFILSAARECDPATVNAFLKRCIRPALVAAAYLSRDASVGSLAGCVRTFAIHESTEVRGFFQNEALSERLWDECPHPKHGVSDVGAWLQLLAAARLLAVAAPSHSPEPLGQKRLSALLQTYSPTPNQSIQTQQGWVWHGLREWLFLTHETFVADQSLAEEVLRAFRGADADGRPRLAQLNSIMVDWLEHCKDQGWLMASKESLFAVMQRRIIS
jgi:hypothetical protein